MQPHEHVILEICRERERQMSKEGWTPEHDDTHVNGELARAASCYAFATDKLSLEWWPWERAWWKPTTPRRNLVKAAALIVAEIERLDRARARAQAA